MPLKFEHVSGKKEKFSDMKGIIRGDIDVSTVINALEDWQLQLIRGSELKQATRAAANVTRPRIIELYGSGPKRITGALSRRGSTRVKDLFYRNTGTAISVAGQRTRNVKTYMIDPKKAGKFARWHANQNAKGNFGKYRHFKKGFKASDSQDIFSFGIAGMKIRGIRQTILGNKAWGINDSVKWDTKTYKRKKPKRVLKVRRDPSRIAHLIEKGHRFPIGGRRARAFNVISDAHKQTRNMAQKALIETLKQKTTAKAQRAAQKGNR